MVSEHDSSMNEAGRYGGNRSDGMGGYGEHTKVGSYLPNAWGLYDMHGNVYEWCLDWYKEKLAPAVEPEENPVGPLQADSTGNRVLRGGSYTATGDRARSAYRYNYNAPEKASVQTGFRLWCPAVVK